MRYNIYPDMRSFHNFRVLLWKNVLLYWRHKGMLVLHFVFSLAAMLLIKYASQDPSSHPGFATQTKGIILERMEPGDLPVVPDMHKSEASWFPRVPGFFQSPNHQDASPVASIKQDSNDASSHIPECEAILNEGISGLICSEAMKAFPGTNVAFIILPHTPPNPKERCYTFVLCTSNAAVDTYLMTETEIRSSAANSYRLQWAMNLVNNENMLKHDEDMNSNPDPRQQAIARKLQDAAITYDKFSVSFRRREIFVYVIICTYLFYMPIFLHPLALEKKLGIKDIFRAMGVSRMQYWLSWWTIDGAIVCIITLVILCCLYIPVFSQEPGQHMFSQQPKYLILLLLLAHGFEIIAFTCLIANVCPNSSFGVTVGLLFRLLIASLVSEMAVYGRLFDHPLYALVPSAPMYILMEPARGAASRKNDLEWMAMTSVMVYMVLFCLLACYAEPLVPGKFGEKMSPGYLFDKSYWTGEWGPSVIKDQKEENDKFWRIQEIQQAKRPNVLPDVAIVAENLHKDHAKVSGCSTCRNSTAMKGISFVALDNQITVFLGKNHSGKTTLMHTLAGFCRQSSGSIRVYKKAKETPVGICPYADYLYPELTPREHLYLYGGLREIDWGVVGDETTVLLDIVHLLHRRHDRCGTLSFALRRLVSLLAAVVGRPRLIMIDQPSEGTDRQTQNALWTLLKVLKEDRTIVFTTQSAKEASALGDRIVMIHKGENVISGSMAEIEAALIPGQPAHLVITPAPGRNAADTDILIRTAFPSAFLLPCTIKNDQLIYQYNPRNQAKLLMDQIEAAKGELGVQTVKMGSHDESYEDETAFLLAGEMPTPSAKRPRSFSWAPNPAQNLPDASVCAHLKAELWKKGLVALRRKWLIMFQLAAIILAAIVIMISANKVASDFAVSHLREDSPDSTTSNHAAKLQNADKIITCGKLKDLDKEKTSSAAGEWYAFQVSRLVIPICLLVCSFSWGPTDERVKQTKQLQLIASLKPGIYWLTHFLGDMTLYCLALCLMTLAVLAIDAGTDSILIPYTGVFMLIFVTFGIAGILMAYCASFLFNGRTNSIAALMFLVVVGDVLYYINEVVRGGGRGWLTRTLAVLPTFCVLKATDALARTAFRMQVIQPIITNYTGLAKVLPLEGLDCIGIGGRLDSGTVITIRNLAHTHRAMFEWGNEVSLYLLILAGSSILLLTCLVLFEVFGNFGDFTCGTKQYVRNYEAAVSGRVSDDYVGEEADRIESLVASEKVHEEHLVVANVFKRFQRKLPIRGISFGVHYGECFGLLGVNGAGKTLVFKIVSGLVLPSRGSVWIEGKKLARNNSRAFRNVGYCPQFDGFLHLLTGRETLVLMAKLKGIPPGDVDARVAEVLHLTNMGEEANDLCQRYSEGTHRKLSTGIAILGDPKLLLLDEPTAGLDLETKKRIWAWILAGLESGKHSVLMTTNCLEEAELLCDRLGILVNGQIKCIGTPDFLTGKICPGTILTAPYALDVENAEFRAARKSIILALGPEGILEEATQLGYLVFRVKPEIISMEKIHAVMQETMQKYSFLLGYECTSAKFVDVFLRLSKLNEPLEDEIPVCPNIIC